MKYFFDFFPIILFFVTYKFFGIYSATVIAMITSVLQVIYIKYKYNSIEKMQLANLVIILTLGSTTLFLHNPMFIKWKPTGVYWVTSLVFLFYHFFNKKTPIQNMMEKEVSLPHAIWNKINIMWIFFFFLMGTANIYVAYNFSTSAWVNFKLFGGISFTIIFIFLQGLYISQFISKNNIKNTA